MKALAIISLLVLSVSLAGAQLLTPASVGLTATATDSGVTTTWNDISALGYTAEYRLFRTISSNKTALTDTTGIRYTDTSYTDAPKIQYQVRVTVNGSLYVWSEIVTTYGPFYELVAWTSWGQENIHPFDYPTGGSSSKIYDDLP